MRGACEYGLGWCSNGEEAGVQIDSKFQIVSVLRIFEQEQEFVQDFVLDKASKSMLFYGIPAMNPGSKIPLHLFPRSTSGRVHQ